MIFRLPRLAILFPIALFAIVATFIAQPVRAQNGTWVGVTSSPATPSPRREFGAIYDAESQRYLIFSGSTTPYQLFNEVWVLSLSSTPSWTHLTITGALPGERHSPQWGYDAARKRVLIFGGYGRHYPESPNYEYLNDVWQLSLSGTPHWTELHPAGQAPAGRLAGAAVFDPMRQRFVGFGGTAGAPVDTWVLNLRGQANWQPLPVDGPRPNGGWGMTSAYDARRDRMLIFGGSLDDQYYGSKNDVWELDLRGLPKWKLVVTAGERPKERRSSTAIFDPIRNRMVIYGGFDAVPGSDQFLADAWAIDFNSSTPTWSKLLTAGTTPAGRDAMAAAYDPLHDRMVVFGGWSGTSMLGDTHFLEWGDTSDDAVLTPTSIATPAAAHLEWQVQAATSTLAAIYRRDPGGEWTSLAEAEVDGSGRLLFDDATITPGNEYGYMMVVGSERGETFGGEALVQVPSSLGVGPGRTSDFALARIAPNPVIDRMSVSFTLASSQPATIELIDVTGRRWMSRDVGALGAGAHEIELSTAGQLREGLYFLRLAQGNRVASNRVVITAR